MPFNPQSAIRNRNTASSWMRARVARSGCDSSPPSRGGDEERVLLESDCANGRQALMWLAATPAMNTIEAARAAIIEAARGRTAQGVNATFVARAEVEQARLHLAQGDVAAAGRWAKAANLNPDGPLAPWRESEYLTLARVLIAQGQAEKAMPILESFSQSAAAAKRNGNLIEILAVEATALHASGRSGAAVDCLKQALAMAEDADYARVFVDEGEPMRALLHQLYQQSKKDREERFGFSRGYVERLLL
ncbi:MAG: hypothetical protein ACREAM_17670, partial [Blastocatellia bacterium]